MQVNFFLKNIHFTDPKCVENVIPIHDSLTTKVSQLVPKSICILVHFYKEAALMQYNLWRIKPFVNNDCISNKLTFYLTH